MVGVLVVVVVVVDVEVLVKDALVLEVDVLCLVLVLGDFMKSVSGCCVTLTTTLGFGDVNVVVL